MTSMSCYGSIFTSKIIGGKRMSSLHYIFASMNASKSAQLLMVAHNYEERNYSVFIVKPFIDTRDGEYVRSRALDVKRKADLIIHKGDSIVTKIRAARMLDGKSPDVILVDEAQFLTESQVDDLASIVDSWDIPVMAYGLRTDSFTNLFEGSRRLFEIADKFQEFKTICPCCGKKAIINMRTDQDGRPVFEGDQIAPGTNYLPVCRNYYKKLKLESESKA